MHLAIPSIALLLVSALGAMAAPESTLINFGICTCFRPAYDASCCIPAGGSMNGNVCNTPDFKGSVKKFEDCCTKSSGTIKCKGGYRDPKNPWPPAGSYGCNIKK
ncbi:hypothetical protein BGZ98_007442 [Dissophora globulifera]|nr:hypothetical protein BGZ98_007442 [Dissophora globulifera]